MPLGKALFRLARARQKRKVRAPAGGYGELAVSLIQDLVGLGCLQKLPLREEEGRNLYAFSSGGTKIENTYPFGGDHELVEPGGGVWAKCRASRIRSVIRRMEVHKLFDVGSGDGSDLTVPLWRSGIDVVGLEPWGTKAHKLAAAGVPTVRGSVQDLSDFGEDKIPNIGMFDSLQYVPAHEQVLRRVFQSLEPGGLIFITVPGVKWLFSSYDKAVGNLRRFSRRELRLELHAAGFQVAKIEGLFSFLIPFAVIRKLLPQKPLEMASGGTKTLDRVAPLFALLSGIEQELPVPHGLSLLAVARKPAQ